MYKVSPITFHFLVIQGKCKPGGGVLYTLKGCNLRKITLGCLRVMRHTQWGGTPPSKQAARTHGESALNRANQDSRIRHTFKHARHTMNCKHKRRGYNAANLTKSRKLFTPHSHTSCGEGHSTWDCSSPGEEVNRSISCSHLPIN